MRRIVEWVPVFPKMEQKEVAGVARSKQLAQDICARLELPSVKPAPKAVHLYSAEGLRWIRVGLSDHDLAVPATMLKIGAEIQSCLAENETLFFHALRPYDLMFFLEGGNLDDTALPPDHYGSPYRVVAEAWMTAGMTGPGTASTMLHAPAPRKHAVKGRAQTRAPRG